MKKFDELYESIINEKIKLSSYTSTNIKFFDTIKKMIKAKGYTIENAFDGINVTFTGGDFDGGSLIFIDGILSGFEVNDVIYQVPKNAKSIKDLKNIKALVDSAKPVKSKKQLKPLSDIKLGEYIDGIKVFKEECPELKKDGGILRDKVGNIVYYQPNYKRHREDGPAIIRADGYKSWWINGKKHREDGPAVVRTNGNKELYIDGKRHREDGPAIEFNSGSKEWYIKGELHRIDGPAAEYKNGKKHWYFKDNLIITTNGKVTPGQLAKFKLKLL